MSRVRLSRAINLVLVLCLVLPAGVSAQTSSAISRVTIEPTRPVLPPVSTGKPVEVRVRVAPGAKLAGAEVLTLELAFGGPFILGNQRTYPLARQQDGAWEGKVPFGWNYAVFYIKTAEGRFENNDGRYWEILSCGEDGTPTEGAVNNQALSYELGKIAPAIQFQPDSAHALQILEEDIKRGRFRSDLYYRLNVIAIHLPPLRERRDDIPIFVDAFLTRITKQHGDPPRRLAPEALEAVMAYDWPGNVRELENALERAVVVTKGELIGLAAMPDRVTERRASPFIAERPHQNPTLEVIERAYIQWVLQAEGGNKSRAAEVLGIDPSTLYRKLSRYEGDAAD